MNGNFLIEQLGLRYPLLEGGMARVGTGAFAAAVSNAGGLGIIGSGNMEPEHLRAALDECRAALEPGRPFGVNLMMLNPRVDDLLAMLVAEKVPVVTTGAGSPTRVIKALHGSGTLVMPVIASPLMAKRAEAAGADAVIAEGCEAGGHVGRLTTMSLLPQVIEAVDIPVIAAGGIATPRQLLAAYVMGAAGVQVGTMLLVADECPVHENFKASVAKAKVEDVITIGRVGGTPCQLLKNKMARRYLKEERAGADWETLERMALGGLRKAVVEGDVDEGAVMVGQNAGLVSTGKPVATLIAELFEGAEALLPELCAAWKERGYGQA